MSKLPSTIEELSAPSEYLQEVLATPPRWILRWGEVLVFTLLLLGWLIHYPDRIPAEVVITTPNPPVAIPARSDGKLAYLPVTDHSPVAAGALLAVIDNAASYGDVLQLQQQLTASEGSLAWVKDSLLKASYQLGTLQEAYTRMQLARKEYALHLLLIPNYQQQQAVGKQLLRYQALLQQKQNHLRLLERKRQLAEKDYRRNEQLHASRVIADKALEDQERAWIATQESYEALLTEFSHIRVQVATLEREWQQFAVQHTQQGEQVRVVLLSAVENLRSAIIQWEEQYLLKAPIAGYVSFTDFWSEQQFVTAGQTVMSVIPAVDAGDLAILKKEQSVIGQLRVPVENFGKVALMQRVQVYLNNYPYQEYGMLEGTVSNISSLPKQGHYHVTITFPKGLTTQYGKEIPFSQQLQGQAEIITEELRLLERIFYHLRALLDTSF